MDTTVASATLDGHGNLSETIEAQKQRISNLRTAYYEGTSAAYESASLAQALALMNTVEN
jgi:hypothetical protein